MPRVHHVKKARKDNPVVKAGEPYYWWKSRFSPKRYSTTYPRPSQLVTSEKLAQFADAHEMVEDAFGDLVVNMDGFSEVVSNLVDILEEASQSIQEVGAGYQEGAENQREYFPESEQADESEEKAYACDSVADYIEQARGEIQQLVDDDRPDEEVYDDVSNFIEGIEWDEFSWV